MENTTISNLIEVLNSAFEADPQAIHALICNRVPCNEKLADHPTILVSTNPVGGGYTVGALGLINGLLQAAGMPRIAVEFSDEIDDKSQAKMLGFCEYKLPSKKD